MTYRRYSGTLHHWILTEMTGQHQCCDVFSHQGFSSTHLIRCPSPLTVLQPAGESHCIKRNIVHRAICVIRGDEVVIAAIGPLTLDLATQKLDSEETSDQVDQMMLQCAVDLGLDGAVAGHVAHSALSLSEIVTSYKELDRKKGSLIQFGVFSS